MENVKSFIFGVIQKARRDNIGERAAGLAYYMIFALIPLLLLLVSTLGFFLPSGEIQDLVIHYFSGNVAGTPIFFTGLFQGISSFKISTIASIIGVVIVAYAATNLFVHLHRTFATIFGLPQPGGSFFHQKVKERGRAFTYAALLIVLIFILIVGNIASSLFFGEVQGISGTAVPTFFFAIGRSACTFIVSVFVFEFLYHFASEDRLPWRSAFWGGIAAAIIFFFINTILSMYLSFSDNLSAYGTIGFFIAFLLWFYYTSFALFLGAEVACLFKEMHPEPRVKMFFLKLFGGRSRN